MKNLRIEHLKNLMEFDLRDFAVEYTDEGWVAKNKSELEWLEEFDKAVEALEENKVDTMNFVEYQDYIDTAKQLGLI